MTLRHRNTAKRWSRWTMPCAYCSSVRGKEGITPWRSVCVYIYVRGCQLYSSPNTSTKRVCLVCSGLSLARPLARKKKDGGTVTYGHPLWDQCANRLLFFRLLDPEQTGSIYRERERERVRTEDGWEDVASWVLLRERMEAIKGVCEWECCWVVELSCWVLQDDGVRLVSFFFLPRTEGESDRDYVFHVLCRIHGFSNWPLQQLTTPHHAHSSSLLRRLYGMTGWLAGSLSCILFLTLPRSPNGLLLTQKSKLELPPLRMNHQSMIRHRLAAREFIGRHQKDIKNGTALTFLTWIVVKSACLSWSSSCLDPLQEFLL